MVWVFLRGDILLEFFQGVPSIQVVATLENHVIPILPLEFSGFISFGDMGWSIKIYQRVHPFQAVAALGARSFSILFLSRCG